MKPSSWSSLLLLACIGLGACAKTTITDHVLAAKPPVDAARLGRSLLVVETALPDAQGKGASPGSAEAIRLIRESFAAAGTAEADSEERLLAKARAEGFDSLVLVRIEDYVRRGDLYVGIALPPVSWRTATLISLRLKALDTKTGAVIADLRRDRTRGGLYTLRSSRDLPAEMKALIQSLVRS